MSKLKKNKILATPLVVLAMATSAYLTISLVSNEGNNQLNSKMNDSNENAVIVNQNSRMYNGTILDKEAVTTLGWESKSTITLDDWKQAPNVTELGSTRAVDAPFIGNSTIKSIEIPKRITNIDTNSFVTSSLENITFESESQLNTIGPAAFSFTKLNQILIPKSVVTIKSNAFSGSSGDLNSQIKEINFESNSKLEVIESNAFTNTAIQNINIPTSVKSINSSTFSRTSKLKNISMPIHLQTSGPSYGFTQDQWDSIDWRLPIFNGTILDKAAITTLRWNTKSTITLDDWKQAPNVTQISDGTITSANDSPFGNSTTITSIAIPKRIVTISNFAFENTSALSSITFEKDSSLTTIGTSAFKNSGITSIEIPNSVTLIDGDSFSNTSSLESITLSYTLFGDLSPKYGFTQKQWESANLIGVPKEGKINKIIARELLKDNLEITWDEISNYSGIDVAAFKDTKITSIEIQFKPNFSIGDNAFQDTTDLKNIKISDKYKKDVQNFGFTNEQIASINYIISSNDGQKNNTGAIVGSITGILLAAALGGGIFFIWKKKMNKNLAYDSGAIDIDENQQEYEQTFDYDENQNYEDYTQEDEYENYEEEYDTQNDEYENQEK